MLEIVTENNPNQKDGLIYYLLLIGKSYTIILFILTILFGLARGFEGPSFFFGFKDGISFGLVVTNFLIGIIVIVDLIERLRSLKKFKRISFRSKQNRILLVNEESKKVFYQIINIFNKENYEIIISDIDKGSIVAKARRSWKSFGEKIIVEIKKASNKKQIVELSSQPILFTTVLDYGKNFVNIENLLLNLKEIDQHQS